MTSGSLSSVSDAGLLAGANLAALGTGDPAAWELVQFRTADLVAPGVWRLSGLLRGQFGSDAAMPDVLPSGAYFVLLDGTPPERILCLTYTKAAASEMQNRLLGRLGGWSMLPDEALRGELRHLGIGGAADLRAAVGREAMVMVDQEGGRVQRLRPPHWTDWPAAMDSAADGAHAVRLRPLLLGAFASHLLGVSRVDSDALIAAMRTGSPGSAGKGARRARPW